MEILQLVISILSGIAVCIPLGIQLANAIEKLIKEKNWSYIMKETLRFMTLAEVKYETGAERKEWVLTMVQEAADAIHYAVDMAAVGQLIDDVCTASKVLTSKKKAGEGDVA